MNKLIIFDLCTIASKLIVSSINSVDQAKIWRDPPDTRSIVGGLNNYVKLLKPGLCEKVVAYENVSVDLVISLSEETQRLSVGFAFCFWWAE